MVIQNRRKMNQLLIFLSLVVAGFAALDKSCVKPCPRDYRPVCGSDGKTYSNTCTMEVAACLQDKEISVAYEGRCTMKKNDCQKFCPLIYRPVCGSDGKTYPSPCNLKAKACASGKKIEIEHEGKCEDKALDESCVKPCPRIYRPVCGSDGKTYSNTCTMEVEACLQDKEISVAYQGRCKDEKN